MNCYQEIDLRRRVLFAYEFGRVKLAIGKTWSALLITWISFGYCGQPDFSIIAGGFLYLLTNGMIIKGGIYGKAVHSGLVAGWMAFLVPLIGVKALQCCDHSTQSFLDAFMLINVVGGVLAGLFIGYSSSHWSRKKNVFLIAASAIAILTGTLGCILFGATGVVGLLFGLLVATTPLLIYRYSVT